MKTLSRIQATSILALFTLSPSFTVAGQGVSMANVGSGGQPSALTKQPAGTVDPNALHKREWRYTVHPGDTLEISFLLTPDFTQTVIVQPDGYITLRDVGTLRAVGQTIPELTESVKKAYTKLLLDPELSIDAKDFERPYITVGGQVGRPGKIDWRGDVTLTQAIALAGGFTDNAKHSQVLLFRRVSDQWAETKLINVKQMLNARNLSEDPIIEPGDMLYVPKNTISKVRPYIPIPSLGLYASQF
jgi:polysaccharide biosynthesis/export protein